MGKPSSCMEGDKPLVAAADGVLCSRTPTASVQQHLSSREGRGVAAHRGVREQCSSQVHGSQCSGGAYE